VHFLHLCVISAITNTPQKTYRIAQYTDSWNRLHPLLGWHHEQVTLYNIISLGTLLTQPRPARMHYFPVTLFTHTNAAHGIVAVLARV
jgi:hypothetical protein